MPKNRQSRETKKALRDYRLATPDGKLASQDGGIEVVREIRLRWWGIVDALIRAAEDGDSRAFRILREEAFGTPASAAPQKSSDRKS
jgi:hypothetical protein